MLRLSPRGIWDTDARRLDLQNPHVLRWYVQRKIQAADWGALDRTMLARVLPDLRIDSSLKRVLAAFLTSHAQDSRTHRRPARRPRRRRA